MKILRLPARLGAVLTLVTLSAAGPGHGPEGENSARVRVTALTGETALIESWKLGEGGALIGRPIGTAGFGAAFGQPAEGLWQLPAQQLWRLRPVQAPAEKSTAAAGPVPSSFVQLRSGASLPAEFLGGSGRDWKLRIGFGQQQSEGVVPYPLLQALRLEAAPEGEDGGFAAALAEPSESRDYVFYWDKDRKKLSRLSVLVRGFQDDKFVVERGDRELQIPRDRVHGIVFSRFGGVDPQPAGGTGRVRILLADGSELGGQLQASEQRAHVGLRLFDVIDVELPFDQVRKIEWLSPRLRYVSELESKIVERVPPLEAEPLLRKDEGLGGALALGEETYERGLWVLPGLRVEFTIPEELRRDGLQLLGRLGMPGAAFGTARVRLFAGEKQLGEEIALTADGKIHPLALDVGTAPTLRIEVLAGEDLDAGGQVVFGELRLLAHE